MSCQILPHRQSKLDYWSPSILFSHNWEPRRAANFIHIQEVCTKRPDFHSDGNVFIIALLSNSVTVSAWRVEGSFGHFSPFWFPVTSNHCFFSTRLICTERLGNVLLDVRYYHYFKILRSVYFIIHTLIYFTIKPSFISNTWGTQKAWNISSIKYKCYNMHLYNWCQI